MRGNAPWHCVRVYALGARGIFAQRKNAECINRGVRFPRALPWAMGSNWAFSPPRAVNYDFYTALSGSILLRRASVEHKRDDGE